jgi:primosomal replication protein N|tara:strand:- start:208 stop:669 length:462 start_codon:yes stop_codon:yes gene_type:complete
MSSRDPLEFDEAELRPHAMGALSADDKAVNSFLKLHGLDQRRLEALYHHRRSILENIVNTTLRTRKNQVASQLQRVTHAAHRVQEMRRMIEQETQVETDGILSRLNANSRMKKMTLEVRACVCMCARAWLSEMRHHYNLTSPPRSLFSLASLL